MTEEKPGEPVTLYPHAPKWKKSLLATIHTRMSAQGNIASREVGFVSDQRGNFDSIFSKSARLVPENPVNGVEGLKNEFDLLNRLQESGVTPRPLLLKVSPDEKEAHLALKVVPGVSLDQHPELLADFVARFNDVVSVSSRALTKVHQAGVFILDINAGTFLYEGLMDSSADLKVYLADFELGITEDRLRDPNIQKKLKDRLGSFFDVGFDMAKSKPDFAIDVSVLRKMEQTNMVRGFLDQVLGERLVYPPRFDALEPKDQEEYRRNAEFIWNYSKERSVKRLRGMYDISPSLNSVMSKDEFVQERLGEEMQLDLQHANLSLFLPYYFKDAGINIDPKVMSFLQQTQALDFTERPERMS